MAGSLVHITGPDDERLSPYRNVRDAHLRADRDERTGPLFMAEGEVVVRQLVASRYPVDSVLLTPTRLETVGDVIDALPAETPVYCVEQPVMDAVARFHIHRGLLAAGRRVPEPALESLLTSGGPLVALEDLSNHDNVGAIFRNAAAFGATGVLLSPRCADPLYRKALRVSVGHAMRVPFTGASPWPECLESVRAAGWETVALATGDGSIAIEEALPGLRGKRVVLVVGAEGPGLTAGAMGVCGISVRIPMASDVDSLNVAQACGIALHRLSAGSIG